MKRLVIAAAASALVAGCGPSEKTSADADAIYSGGDILTMAGAEPAYVEALAVKDGKIELAGSKADAAKLKGAGTKEIDLKGRTLLPGFIDTHGHMVYFGKNLIDADLFGTKDIPDLIQRMKAQAEKTPARCVGRRLRISG